MWTSAKALYRVADFQAYVNTCETCVAQLIMRRSCPQCKLGLSRSMNPDPEWHLTNNWISEVCKITLVQLFRAWAYLLNGTCCISEWLCVNLVWTESDGSCQVQYICLQTFIVFDLSVHTALLLGSGNLTCVFSNHTVKPVLMV